MTTADLQRQAYIQDALLTRRAERSFRDYAEQAWPTLERKPFLPNWHIDLIAEHLQAVTDGHTTRLLVNVPPRYMKSLLVSVLWPTWEWIQNPSLRFIFTSHTESLALKHSVDRRTLLQSPWYQERWGTRVQLAADQNVKGEFCNTARGAMIATSIGGSITGKGADRIIIDDPHNPSQIDSDLQREAVLEYVRRTLSTRLDDNKHGAMIVVMQRLHEQDLSAFCRGLVYVQVCLPAEAETRTEIRFPRSGLLKIREAGDLLWPARDGRAELEAQLAFLGPADYAAQYQQEPVPASGGLFKREWFANAFVDAVPVDARRVRGWDTAGTEGAGDWTCGVKIAEKDGIFYVEDVQRHQLGPNGVDALIRATAETDGRACAQREEKEGGSAGGAVIAARMKTLAGFDYDGVDISGSKVTRCKPFRAQCEAGNVRIVRRAWNADYIHELCGFPNAKHDDQVDASSCAFNAVLLEPEAFDWRKAGFTSPCTW